MTQAATSSNIASALVKAQIAFQPALKNSVNPHFRSKYVDLASCVDSVVGALNANGIFLFQTTTEHDNGVICETSFLHESGERLDCGKLFFPASKLDPQGFMSCLTYIRRASLMAATCQAPEDDDGNAALKPKANIVDHLSAIEASANSAELAKVFEAAKKACLGDPALIAQIEAAKQKRIDKAQKDKAKGSNPLDIMSIDQDGVIATAKTVPSKKTATAV
jgi:hypothetical protein